VKKFSEWLERRIGESSNPDLGGLKDQEKEILNKMGLLKDPAGRIIGFNAYTFRQLSEKLKEVRARIKTIEKKENVEKEEGGGAKQLPSWLQSRRAV